jgi:hypothetical protein
MPVNITDNWFEDNSGESIYFSQEPTGNWTIAGNVFRGNFGPSIVVGPKKKEWGSAAEMMHDLRSHVGELPADKQEAAIVLFDQFDRESTVHGRKAVVERLGSLLNNLAANGLWAALLWAIAHFPHH